MHFAGGVNRRTDMARLLKLDMTIRKYGDAWKIYSMGISKDGNTWCHIGSKTQFRKQKNGNNPIQKQLWIKGLPLQPEYIVPLNEQFETS